MAYEIVRRIGKDASLLKDYVFGRYRYTVSRDRNGVPFIPDATQNYTLTVKSAIENYRTEKALESQRSNAASALAKARWSKTNPSERSEIMRAVRSVPTTCPKCGILCDTARIARVHCRRNRSAT